MPNRYPDQHSAGKSDICPHKRHESSEDRHRRRMETAWRHQRSVRDWANKHGVQFTITNGHHHWTLWNDSHVVEWWPSRAKCVVDRRYANGTHLHDVEQLIKLCEKTFGVTSND